MGNLDENDHLTVAYLMTKGSYLYTDIFSHHFPFPYYWTYIFTSFWSENSPSKTISIFRLSLTVIQLLIFILVYLNLEKNRTKFLFSIWLLFFAFFYPIYQGNLILSESFTAVFMAGYMWILIPILIKWEECSLKKLLSLQLLSALTFWTQPLLVGLFFVPYFLSSNKQNRIYLSITSGLLIIIPLLFFLMTGQLYNFIEQAVWFNYQIYPNLFFTFLIPDSKFSPIIQTIILFIQNEFKLFTSINNWLQLFQFITHLSVYYLIFLLLKKKLYSQSIIFLLILLFSRLREIKITPGVPFEFGIYPFIVIASISSLFLIFNLYTKNKLVGIIVGIVLLIASFMPLKPIIIQSLDRSYNYYVFWSPKQDIGQLIQKLTNSNEKILIYPHDVDLYYFAQREPIDKFLYWYLWIDAVNTYKNERMETLEKNPPAVMYIGNVSYKEDKYYYSRFFPNLTKGYIQIKKDGKPTGIWLREDLQERASLL